MVRRRVAIVGLATVAALVVPAAPAHAVFTEIKGLSHFHPTEAEHSWVGVRVRATKRARVEVHLAGPAVVSENPVSCRAPGASAPRRKRGKVLAVFKIAQPGEYTAHVMATKGGETANDQANYTVPDDSGAKEGPFDFRRTAGCYGGWPTD